MNNFTKEELNHMANGLALIVGKCNLTNKLEEDLLALVIKINSVLENYCEHECSPESMIDIPFHCLKCGIKL